MKQGQLRSNQRSATHERMEKQISRNVMNVCIKLGCFQAAGKRRIGVFGSIESLEIVGFDRQN